MANRTRLQKSAYVKFWRSRKGLSIDLEDNLLYAKKKNVKKSDVKSMVTKTFIKNKSRRCRKNRARVADVYSRLTHFQPMFHLYTP